MKLLLSFFVLIISIASYAQERIILNSETALINSDNAILVRTAETPEIVNIYFNVPMKRLVCTRRIVYRTGRATTSRCIEYKKVTTHDPDKVKLRFKSLPVLGGSEEDTFLIKAKQKRFDGENVIYDISSLNTISPYKILKKGILGFDSYVVELN